MSFDLYLLPLRQTGDFDAAMALLNALDRKDPGYAYELDARDAAQAILQLDPRYKPLQIEAAETQRLKATDAGKAYLQTISESVQLTGRAEDGQPLAHFHFYHYHIIIHCYSGTSADELDKYVITLCGATGFAAVDPQEYAVRRLQEDGTLA